MGYPTTTFNLYTDEGFKGALNIVGDVTKKWAVIVDAIASCLPEIGSIKNLKMNGDLFMEVQLCSVI